MTWQAYASTRPRFLWLAALSAIGLFACASSSPIGTGGSNGSASGGSSGTLTGGPTGSSNGGSSGTLTGGPTGSGTGGTTLSTGSTSGASTGSTSGASTGSTSGAGTGSTGSTSGASTGSTSGASTGSTSGASSGSSGTVAGDPPGYYKTADWGVTSVDWHGCVWTGWDSTVANSTTTITPHDFTAAPKEGGPYEVSGTVYNDYNAVALLGFNLNEATTGSSTQCVHNSAASTKAGPPAGTIPSSATGIAVNWSQAKTPPTSFRIQLQSADGATNPMDTWCATITDPTGPSFIPFTSFYQQCWNVGTTTSPGAAFNPKTNSVDAVAFLVPGTVQETAPFDFTVVGFAPGTSKSDAPAGGTKACGTLTGTLGTGGPSMVASYQRAAVTGTDCKEYVIQNNNWGNPTGSSQLVNYSGTGFTVQSSNGSGSSAPASFPSTYVGANGNIANGTYSTWSDTGLPKQISTMQSVMTSFGYSGGGGGKDFNATYDVWFAKSPPTAGSYNDGISGFLMVWLYKPANRQPIGSVARTATIADSSGKTHTFNVWVGPRGNTSTGTDAASRPVISYVAQDSPTSLTFDLLKFMDDAVSHADTNNGVTGPFQSSWYLTDVFAGFEIWTGSDATNLKSSGFSLAVK